MPSPERLAEVYLLVGPLYRRAQRLVDDDLAPHGLHAGTRSVLEMLRRLGPLTVPRMGREQSLSRQFVQRCVNEAAERGLVALTDNPAHRRSRLVALTDRGRAAIDDVLARERARLGAVDVPDADVEVCVRVLRRMLAALDDVDVG